MIDEQRILELEIKIQEQENLIKDLFKIALQHQQMINERAVASQEIQVQLNDFMESFLKLYKK